MCLRIELAAVFWYSWIEHFLSLQLPAWYAIRSPEHYWRHQLQRAENWSGFLKNYLFLAGSEIEKADRPDNSGLEGFHFVLGYPASRTQVKLRRGSTCIQQQSFHCSMSSVEPSEYIQENLSESDRILLDFDHKTISAQGKRAAPPRLQGVSGGGIFLFQGIPAEGHWLQLPRIIAAAPGSLPAQESNTFLH